MISKKPLKKGQVEDVFAVRDEENAFTEANEFTKPLKVADGVADRDAINLGQLEDEINGIQGQLETFLVGGDGGRLSLGMSFYHILGKKIDIIRPGGTITAPQDLNQILSGDLSIRIDEIPGLQLLAATSVTLNRFRVGTVFREDVRAETATHIYNFIELRQGAVTSNPLTSSIFTTGVRNISIEFHISGIIIIT